MHACDTKTSLFLPHSTQKTASKLFSPVFTRIFSYFVCSYKFHCKHRHLCVCFLQVICVLLVSLSLFAHIFYFTNTFVQKDYLLFFQLHNFFYQKWIHKGNTFSRLNKGVALNNVKLKALLSWKKNITKLHSINKGVLVNYVENGNNF